MNVRFPRNSGQRYYDLHFKYMLGIFHALNWPIDLFDDDTGERGCFKMYLDGHEVMVDFSDYGHEYTGDLPCLRFHYKMEHAKPNIYPFAPGSFWNWPQYEEFKNKLTYKAEGLVMHNQYPHCNNLERRTKVRRMVEDWADKKLAAGIILPKGNGYVDGRELNGADTNYFGIKEYYWNSLKDCLVSIHVPGQNNNMLDSAQLQLMAFGYCTISPELPEVLPFGRTLAPDYHYVLCADDYSDLQEKIDWCRSHQAECLAIGHQVKVNFQQTCTPRVLGQWMEQLLAEGKFSG